MMVRSAIFLQLAQWSTPPTPSADEKCGFLTLSAAGNNNIAASQFNWTYDFCIPMMTITATDGSNAVADGATTNDNTLTVTFTFSEATSNFAASDITVTGGAISNFSASSSTVYIPLRPQQAGQRPLMQLLPISPMR